MASFRHDAAASGAPAVQRIDPRENDRAAWAAALTGLANWARAEGMPLRPEGPTTTHVAGAAAPLVCVDELDDDATTGVFSPPVLVDRDNSSVFDIAALDIDERTDTTDRIVIRGRRRAERVDSTEQVVTGERRRADRVDVKLSVRFTVKGAHGSPRGELANLSCDGLFIRSTATPEIGATVACGFYVNGDSTQLVRLRGTVTWVADDRHRGGAGFGVRIDHASRTHRLRIATLVRELSLEATAELRDRPEAAHIRPHTIPDGRYLALI